MERWRLTDANVDSKNLDDEVLTQTHSQAMIHDEKACLDKPSRDTLHLFGNEHPFRAE